MYFITKILKKRIDSKFLKKKYYILNYAQKQLIKDLSCCYMQYSYLSIALKYLHYC